MVKRGPGRPLSIRGKNMSIKSRPPQRAKRAQTYTLLWFTNETANPKRFSLSRKVLMTFCLFACGILGTMAAMSFEYSKLKATSLEYEKLKVENRSIRSEAKALSARLQEIQSTLNKVDAFSNQVREVVQMDPNSKKKVPGPQTVSESLKVTSFTAGIGPLTRDEFKMYQSPSGKGMGSDKIATAVNPESLEFKDLFTTLRSIKEQGGNQAKHLETILTELQAYRKLVDSTPTISPVNGSISSLYGVRSSPFLKTNRMHWGLDIAAPMGSPIRSAANGTVVRVGFVDDYGRFAEVSHGHGIVTRYAHASRIDVKVGDKVKKGTVLGAVGMTGRTTGPHLHYEIEVNGRRVNPASYIQNL